MDKFDDAYESTPIGKGKFKGKVKSKPKGKKCVDCDAKAAALKAFHRMTGKVK